MDWLSVNWLYLHDLLSFEFINKHSFTHKGMFCDAFLRGLRYETRPFNLLLVNQHKVPNFLLLTVKFSKDTIIIDERVDKYYQVWFFCQRPIQRKLILSSYLVISFKRFCQTKHFFICKQELTYISFNSCSLPLKLTNRENQNDWFTSWKHSCIELSIILIFFWTAPRYHD